MYAMQPKRLLIMNLLAILRKYTDYDHRLSQKDIIELLESEYQMKVERKAVKRNLMNLIDAGYPLSYSESIRRGRNGEDEVIYSDWYLEREFTDAELRLLIDSLLFSKHIPYSQCKELIEKIEGLSNQYFKAKVRHICNLPEDMPENKELFLTIEVLDEAISKNRQVEFSYSDYGTDKKLHPRLNHEGLPRKYLVNPYQMVATNGRYYLIGNYEKYDNISHYRLDRITDIQIIDAPSKPQRKIKGLEHGFNLPKHMAEHIYMFAGEGSRVMMRIKKYIVGEVIDWFGPDVRFTDETENEVIAHVSVNTDAMRYWLLQYAPHVTVLAPQSLVDTVKADLIEAASRYGASMKGETNG